MRASGREAGRARGGIRSPRGPFCVYEVCVRANDPLSRLRRWYLRTAPLCASCVGGARPIGVLGDAADRRVEAPLVFLPGYFPLSFSRLLSVGGCCSWVYLVLES